MAWWLSVFPKQVVEINWNHFSRLLQTPSSLTYNWVNRNLFKQHYNNLDEQLAVVGSWYYIDFLAILSWERHSVWTTEPLWILSIDYIQIFGSDTNFVTISSCIELCSYGSNMNLYYCPNSTWRNGNYAPMGCLLWREVSYISRTVIELIHFTFFLNCDVLSI